MNEYMLYIGLQGLSAGMIMGGSFAFIGYLVGLAMNMFNKMLH